MKRRAETLCGTHGIPARTTLEANHVLGLQAFWALLDFELHRLAFVQSFVSVGLDSRKVNEDIFTTLALDEPITLAGVEPLDCALFFHCQVTS